MRENGVGIKAFQDVKNEELKEKIAEHLVDEFRENKYEKLPTLLEKALQEGGYDDLIRFSINKERDSVGEAGVLGNFANTVELFPTLKDLNFNFDQIVPKAYGLSESDAAPLMVMMTSIEATYDKEGDRKIKIARALLNEGANIDAVDKRVHTAL